ncbi:MAG TPA: corrinoid protein [Candidatus Limnocylindrales bacterium]|nr:corrinoid protein [Candidatus Limnocylindrales bacterium]
MHPLTQAIIDGDKAAATELTRQCLADGEDPGAIIETRLVPGMAVIGERFKCDEIFVPEMLIAANAMKASLAILEPLLAAGGTRAAHTAVIGTVHGDLHDIGKNLVGMMWRGANIEVIDLGVNVSPEAFATAARQHQPDIVGMSALLTTTMPHMKDAVAAVKATGVATKIVIGGAPVSEEFASEVQADGFAPDAGFAVDVVRQLIGAA